jgi:hypothetical protein
LSSSSIGVPIIYVFFEPKMIEDILNVLLLISGVEVTSIPKKYQSGPRSNIMDFSLRHFFAKEMRRRSSPVMSMSST